MSEQNRIDPAEELVRIHSMYTYALDAATERSQLFAQDGFADAQSQQEFVDYARCLVAMLHFHHESEDVVAFPYFQEKIPDVPFDLLTAHHQGIRAMLDDIQEAIETLAGNPQETEAIHDIHRALTQTVALWRPHIQVEEEHFTRETFDAALDPQQQAQFGKRISEFVEGLIAEFHQQNAGLDCQALFSQGP